MSYAALFAVSVLSILGILYWSTVGYLERQTNATIEAEIEGLAEQFKQRGLEGLVAIVADRVRRNDDGRSIYLFADRNYRRLAGNLDRWPPDVTPTVAWVDFQRQANDSLIPVRARVLAVSPGLTLLVGRDIRELARIRQLFRDTAALGIGATLSLAMLVGIWMGFAAQRRIAEINRSTRRIVAGDLRERLPDPGGNDEYAALVANLNSMFDHIEQLLDGIRHTSDSIAHDLRTPLTRLRNNLETLSRAPAIEGAELKKSLQEADDLLATFAAILRIARVESGAYRSAFRRMDIAEVVNDVADLYHAAADESGLVLETDVAGPVWILGDRELVAQALTNLIDNSIKYADGGSRIRLGLVRRDRNVCLQVADNGPGIDLADRERVTKRFVRLGDARNLRGNGLGLALVKAVVEQHRGSLSLEDNHPGLLVEMCFPQG